MMTPQPANVQDVVARLDVERGQAHAVHVRRRDVKVHVGDAQRAIDKGLVNVPRRHEQSAAEGKHSAAHAVIADGAAVHQCIHQLAFGRPHGDGHLRHQLWVGDRPSLKLGAYLFICVLGWRLRVQDGAKQP